MKYLVLIFFVTLLSAEVPTIPYKVIRSIPHDTDAFTQGLLYKDGFLWESTGSPGGGTRIRQIDSQTGEELNSHSESGYFGEGLACDGIMLYQLSWKEQLLRVFTYPQMNPVAMLPYEGEGWGLTINSMGNFLMSNGSDTIYERSSQFKMLTKIPITYEQQPLININELEFHNGVLWANVWYNDAIVRIDVESGEVTGKVDLSLLRQEVGATGKNKVVNGIAALSDTQFWVTGKFWSKLYLIEIGNLLN